MVGRVDVLNGFEAPFDVINEYEYEHDSFFRTVPTKSRAVARAQLKAIMQRRLGIAIIRARVDAHLEALANLDPPHRAYFQNKGHLSQADTARAWRPYDDLPPGWEGVVAPNANVTGDWG